MIKLDGKEYITVKETAELLHVTREHVRYLIKHDKVISIKLDYARYIEKASVVEYDRRRSC